MKLLILSLLSITFNAHLQAEKNYSVVHLSKQKIVIPKFGEVELKAVNDTPNCGQLYRGLEKFKNRIDICKRNDKDVNSCYSLKTNLYKLIWNQKIAIFGYSSPKFIRLEQGDFGFSKLPKLQEIADSNDWDALDLGLGEYPSSSGVLLDEFKIKNKTSEWLKTLSDLKLHEDIFEVSVVDGDLQLNALQYCELKDNKVSLSSNFSLDFSYQSFMEEQKSRLYLELYQDLKETNQNLESKSALEKATFLGVKIGAYAAKESDVKIDDSIKSMIKYNKTSVGIKNYNSTDHFIRSLPKEEKSIEGDIHVYGKI